MSFDPGLSRGEKTDNDELMDIFKVSNSGGMRRNYERNQYLIS
jgi:hypothetical protein